MKSYRHKWIIGLLPVLLGSLLPISYIDARDQGAPGDPIVIRIIELEHADARALVFSLQPFLSPQGRITAYAPANCLIIRDRQSVVNDLVRVIKGKSDP